MSQDFIVPRYSAASLAFTGELLATVSAKSTRPNKTNKRYHEIDLYLTDSGKYVVAIRFRCETRHDDPYDEAEVCESPAEVVEYLTEFDMLANVRGWPLAAHRQEDQRLREALTNNFDRLVSQLLSSRAEFAERV